MPEKSKIVSRAEELLWVIARCDVEDVRAHRATALDHLRDLEIRAAEMRMPNLYREVMRAADNHL
ncbi:MAG TPA: hypothetical protein VLY04_16080 [Bryobacteraceae bacterium]|nr:hypothetical protein [Bryobacteraceae bacterium]